MRHGSKMFCATKRRKTFWQKLFKHKYIFVLHFADSDRQVLLILYLFFFFFRWIIFTIQTWNWIWQLPQGYKLISQRKGNFWEKNFGTVPTVRFSSTQIEIFCELPKLSQIWATIESRCLRETHCTDSAPVKAITGVEHNGGQRYRIPTYHRKLIVWWEIKEENKK